MQPKDNSPVTSRGLKQGGASPPLHRDAGVIEPRIFASPELAARIESAEAALVAGAGAAVNPPLANGATLVQELAGGVAVFTSPGSPFNKLAGLGFGGPIEEAELSAVEEFFEAQEARVQVEVSSLADPGVVASLSRRGYELVGFENVLGLRLPMTPRGTSARITIEVADTDDLEPWLDIVIAGFASPDPVGVPSHESFDAGAVRGAVRDLVRAGGVTQYLARCDGAAAGGASMRIDRGIAQLCGAATLPEQRRRGVQSALLDRRLADAGTAGCDLAVVTTQPGSKSHENVQKFGFELLYTRAVLLSPERKH
jgi:ribosomal protein S18 acetylase RimI-like enzyme